MLPRFRIPVRGVARLIKLDIQAPLGACVPQKAAFKVACCVTLKEAFGPSGLNIKVTVLLKEPVSIAGFAGETNKP